jgi:hypothetical protein
MNLPSNLYGPMHSHAVTQGRLISWLKRTQITYINYSQSSVKVKEWVELYFMHFSHTRTHATWLVHLTLFDLITLIIFERA